MIFEKTFIWVLISLSSGIEALAFSLVFIFYSPEEAKSRIPEASHSSLHSKGAGQGGCDVTGRIIRSWISGHYVDFSCS